MSGVDVRLVLISHTNVGKTSLARTLLRRDVGEVLDSAHTTLENQLHELAHTPQGDRLLLWDTPGFGNSAKLRDRLRSERRPVGWFLGEVWDRATDRSLWCAQQAIRAARDDGDLILYLVNASEDPEFADYIAAELEILEWLEKPVIVLLNQLPPRSRRAERERLEAAWRSAVGRGPVRRVLALDAYERCWLDESRLLTDAAALLEAEGRSAMERLLPLWQAERLQRFDAALEAVAGVLADIGCDREPLGRGQPGRLGRVAALRRLTGRLERSVRQLDETLIALEGLDGAAAQRVSTALTETRAHGERPSPTQGAAGGAVAGAAGGAMIDLLFSGLSFGFFTALGASLSALAGWRWCYQAVDKRTLGWSAAFVKEATIEMTTRYLAVIHHGRARGRYEGVALDSWREPAVEAATREAAAIAPLADDLDRLSPDRTLVLDHARTAARRVITRALVQEYPHGSWLLDHEPPADTPAREARSGTTDPVTQARERAP
ncbi:MAG: DUF3482 domain-containing protein [Pseudomonadales bacterium]|jgi:GTPase SAR1 family protein|nr:DUF3482 domain-containing protein [Pseudomonadales bacterium]